MQSTSYIQRDDPVIRNFVAAKSISLDSVIINVLCFLFKISDDFDQQRTIYY